jgi:hypothetical protein
MPVAELPELGYELDGFVFGMDTPWVVENIDYGVADSIENDTAAPRQDGTLYGRDYLGGPELLLSVSVIPDYPIPGNGIEATDLWGQFKSKWRASDVRGTPGAMSVLRLSRNGRTRRIYGRSRKCAAQPEKDVNGWWIGTASFKASDDFFYSDSEITNTVSIVPPGAGGYLVPPDDPWSSIGVSYAPGVVHIGGTDPAWMTFMIRGPIQRPVIEVVGEWAIGLNLTLREDEWVGIDSRPWQRGVRTSSGADLGGALLPGSPVLSRVRLAPGSHEVVLRGTDPTGTASMTAAWRETYSVI